jgi:hypothetical protein
MQPLGSPGGAAVFAPSATRVSRSREGAGEWSRLRSILIVRKSPVGLLRFRPLAGRPKPGSCCRGPRKGSACARSWSATRSTPSTSEAATRPQRFERILGIRLEHVDYLEGAIQTGVLLAPVGAVRENPPWGVNCVVELPVRGVGEKRGRVVNVRTVWLLTGADARPWLSTSFPKP